MQSRTITRALSLAAILAAAPLTISSAHGIQVSKACSQTELLTGTCCREMNSICNAGGGDNPGYYYKSEGPCH